MNREDIMRMAADAGVSPVNDQQIKFEGPMWLCLERFAALVAAAERKSFAEECEQLAQHAKETGDMNGMVAALALAITIRARGEI